MSAWSDFLTAIQSENAVTLVGPLYHQRHTPLMPTIYVDGGSRYRAAGGWVAAAHAEGQSAFPTISVGDGDSSAGSLDELLPAEKNYSDLSFVLRSLPASIKEVTLLGFLGARRDHELANLGEVADFLKMRSGFARVDLAGPSGDRVVAFAHAPLEISITGLFSVFVLEPANVQISGMCKYQLTPDITLSPLSSHGLSNMGYGKLEVSSNTPAFVLVNSSQAT